MKEDDNNKEKEPKLTIENVKETEKADPTKGLEGKPDEGPSLKEVIREQATEDEAPQSSNFTLRKILGGDILSTRAIRRQVPLLMLITVILFIYISNRYSCQKNLIEIDRLSKELVDAKYRALASSSELTERCRESHVLDLLKNNQDSVLKIASQPPYIIEVPEQ
ncbi:MAG: hypothetical protein IJK42_04095 [Prevotella sp.]|nr:hypothetical protein [Prevotella sp.]